MFSLHRALHRREEFPEFVRAQHFSKYTNTSFICAFAIKHAVFLAFSMIYGNMLVSVNFGTVMKYRSYPS
jgi:hypothetical protein